MNENRTMQKYTPKFKCYKLSNHKNKLPPNYETYTEYKFTSIENGILKCWTDT